MTEEKDSGKVAFFEKPDEEMETTMPQLAQMTKSAWAVFEIQCVNPRATQVEIAQKVGVTRPYVSRIVNSEVYKAEIRKMRKRMLEDRLADLGNRGIQRLTEIVESEESSDADAISATRVGLEAMGILGKNGGGGVTINNNAAPQLGVTAEMVQEAASRRQAKLFNNSGEEVVDAEISQK